MSFEGNIPLPFFWTQERSGFLKEVVQKFMRDESLSHSELKLLRWYVYQWVESHPQKPRNSHWIHNMSQEELKRYIVEVLGREYSIAPF